MGKTEQKRRELFRKYIEDGKTVTEIADITSFSRSYITRLIGNMRRQKGKPGPKPQLRHP